MGLPALKIEDLPHYTYEDYGQWEGKWELIKGIPYAMTPAPVIKHQRLNSKIDRYLGELLKKCKHCEVLLPVDWLIEGDTVVQPDNLVVCHENKNIGEETLTVTPVLIFEILSPSTNRKDRIIKYALYEDAGVKYYCLVDPETGSAEIVELKNKKYRDLGTFTAKGKVTFDLGTCTVKFDFAKIFK